VAVAATVDAVDAATKALDPTVIAAAVDAANVESAAQLAHTRALHNYLKKYQPTPPHPTLPSSCVNFSHVICGCLQAYRDVFIVAAELECV
jgi:hypothetical protein